jgi:hypothetical protein
VKQVLRVVAAVIVVCTAVACDDFYNIELENATGIPIVLHEIGVNRDSQDQVSHLAPGVVRSNNWRYPRRSQAQDQVTVRAETADGQVVFCRKLSFEDVNAARQHITITRGAIDC